MRKNRGWCRSGVGEDRKRGKGMPEEVKRWGGYGRRPMDGGRKGGGRGQGRSSGGRS